jgi:uncharacterized protein (DUF2236 family)
MSVSRKLNAERLVLFGWSRAILMQLAHPLVAAGVVDHSSFRKGPFTAAARLHHTVRAMLSLTFGTPEAQAATIEGIRAIHTRVTGELRQAVGPYPAGTIYRADDSDLLIWVHATLLDSIPLIYERMVGPLSDLERDQYCVEAEPVALALGARQSDIPTSWRALKRYLSAMDASGRLVVSAAARELAGAVLAPPFGRALAPLPTINRVVTVGLLPSGIRQQYGFDWTNRDARSLERWTTRIRRLRPWLPPPVALWPEARGNRAS